MDIPALVELVTPYIIPFLIGLLLGAMMRRIAKLALLGIGLIAVLSAAGYISLGVDEVYRTFWTEFPKVISFGEKLKASLPYTSTAFLLGLAIGLWKG